MSQHKLSERRTPHKRGDGPTTYEFRETRVAHSVFHVARHRIDAAWHEELRHASCQHFDVTLVFDVRQRCCHNASRQVEPCARVEGGELGSDAANYRPTDLSVAKDIVDIQDDNITIGVHFSSR